VVPWTGYRLGRFWNIAWEAAEAGIAIPRELLPGTVPPFDAGRLLLKSRLQGYTTTRIFPAATAASIFVADAGEKEAFPPRIMTSTEGWVNMLIAASRSVPEDPGIDSTTKTESV
jgi:hypothetical protein